MSLAAFATKQSGGAAKAKSAGHGALGSLRIGEPDDTYEREADRVADEVMSGGTLQHHWSLASMGGVNAPLQRKCSCGGSPGASGECEECKKKEEGSQMVQRKAAGPSAGAGAAPPIVNEVLNSPGQPLDRATRDFFEPRFGYDFSGVRVHNDDKSQESAGAVSAHAYTTGSQIVFGRTQYRPHTTAGMRLMAHELAHVIQQSGFRANDGRIGSYGGIHPVMRSAPAVQRQPAKIPCITGKTEGKGVNLSKPHRGPHGEQWVYSVWGKYNEDDTAISFPVRTLTKWIDWRFGKLPADKRAQVEDYISTLIWSPPMVVAEADCYYLVGITPDVLSRIRVLAGEAHEPQQPGPDESTAPLFNAIVGNEPGGAGPPPPPGAEPTKAERGEPLKNADWGVLDKNEPLARQYLLWMQHFAGLPKSTRADELAADGLTSDELVEIIGANQSYAYYTNLITQGYVEFKKDGGKDLDSLNPLMELVLQQFTWGNPTAVKNWLRIGKGDSWVPEERGKIGVVHRLTNLLLYDEMGAPLPSLSGMAWRDLGYVGARQLSVGFNIAEVEDPGLAVLLNVLRQKISDPQRQVAVAAQVLYENVELVKPRVINGLAPEVLKKFEDALPMFVGFLAGHGLSQLLLMSANPYLVLVGGALKVSLAIAGYIMDIDFAASAIERLLLAARYLSRVTRDDSGALTALSEHYLDVAAVPLRDMIADIALLAATAAFGRLIEAIGGRAKERPKIECHSCTVEPKAGEAKPAETAKKPAGPEAAEAIHERAATTKETYSTVLEEIRNLSKQIAERRREQAADSTPERAKTIKALEAELKDLGREAGKLQEQRGREEEQIRKSNLSLYEKIRAATPSTKAAEAVLKRAKGLDEYSGKPTPRPTVDHIVPVKEIVNMEGFDKLTWEQQKAIVDMPENLMSMDGSANSSKGDRSWADWEQASDFYSDPQIKENMKTRDTALRTKIQAEIARLQK